MNRFLTCSDVASIYSLAHRRRTRGGGDDGLGGM